MKLLCYLLDAVRLHPFFQPIKIHANKIYSALISLGSKTKDTIQTLIQMINKQKNRAQINYSS